jgi:Ulp1 family protease
MSDPAPFHVIYEDQEIREADLATIGPGRWVNDVIISFQMRYLQNKYNSLDKFAAFIPACTSQLFQKHPLEFAKSLFQSMQLEPYRFVFFPISDIDTQTRLASHWSLIYMDQRKHGIVLKHFDSLNHNNRTAALAFTRRFTQFLGREEISVEWLDCPRQRNGYDCGAYVMAYVDLLVEADGSHTAACARLTPDFVTEYRIGVEQHIRALATDGHP